MFSQSRNMTVDQASGQPKRAEEPKKKPPNPKMRKLLGVKNTGSKWPNSIQTMTVTLITEVVREEDGKWTTAALRIKEEPGDLLKYYAKHLGVEFEEPDQRTPEWEKDLVRNLCFVLKLRQSSDRRRWPVAFGDGNPVRDAPMPVTRRVQFDLYGDMNLTFQAIITPTERWDLVAQVLMRRHHIYGGLDNPVAMDNKALEQVLDGLYREDIEVRPATFPRDFRDDMMEGEFGIRATFGGGLSGKFVAGMKANDLEENHIDRFKPDKDHGF